MRGREWHIVVHDAASQAAVQNCCQDGVFETRHENRFVNKLVLGPAQADEIPAPAVSTTPDARG